MTLLLPNVIAVQFVEMTQVQLAAGDNRMGPTGAHRAVVLFSPSRLIGKAFGEEAPFDIKALGGAFTQEHLASLFGEDIEHAIGPAAS